MTIEQFLIDTYNNKLWKDIEKYNEAVADAKDLSPDKWNSKWSEYLMSNKYLIQAYKESKLEETTKSLPSRMAMYFSEEGYNPNDVKRRYIRQTYFKDVPKDKFDSVLKSLKEQKEAMDKFNDARYAELNKLSEEDKRARDNSYYNSPIANEYARKHYIQGHPVQAVINEAAGKVAAASDFLPFPFSLGGPAIRTTQKVAADEDVATPGTLADWGGGSLGLLGKIPGVKEAATGSVGRIYQVLTKGKSPRAKEISTILNSKTNKEAEQIAKKDLEILSKKLDDLTDKELLELYKSTDNPVIKQRIEDVHKLRANVEYNKAIKERVQSDKATSYVADAPDNVVERTEQAAIDYENAVNKSIKDAAKLQPTLEVKAGIPKEGKLYNEYGDFIPYYKDVPLEDIATYQATHVDKPSFLSKAIAEGLLGIGRKSAGQTIAHRNWNEINYKPDYNEDKAINEIIRMYSDDWKYGRPANYNEPLIKAAYDKWLNNLYMKRDYDALYRMGEI